jgi:hypothetical protein
MRLDSRFTPDYLRFGLARAGSSSVRKVIIILPVLNSSRVLESLIKDE